MVSESSATSNQTNTSYNFVTPVKLDQNIFIVWRIRVLTSIKDQLLLSWMLSSIQETLLYSVIHCASSQELWDCLTRMFVSQTQACIMPIKMQLQTGAYFAKMKRLADTLAIAGKPVGHADLVTHILIGLDTQEYESLVTSLLTRSESLSLDDLYALLLSHEMRVEQKRSKLNTDVLHNLTANFAKKNQGIFRSGSGNQRDMPNSSPNNNTDPIICQIC